VAKVAFEFAVFKALDILIVKLHKLRISNYSRELNCSLMPMTPSGLVCGCHLFRGKCCLSTHVSTFL